MHVFFETKNISTYLKQLNPINFGRSVIYLTGGAVGIKLRMGVVPDAQI